LSPVRSIISASTSAFLFNFRGPIGPTSLLLEAAVLVTKRREMFLVLPEAGFNFEAPPLVGEDAYGEVVVVCVHTVEKVLRAHSLRA
jgi:hypothetical protein